MAGAGLTHGGFYSYFKSKSDLYAEVLGCFFTDPNWKSCWEGVEVDLSSTDVGSAGRSRVSVAPAFRGCGELLPDGGVCPRTSRVVDKTASTAFRDGLSRHGQRAGAQPHQKWAAATNHRAGPGGLVHRRHDCRQNRRRPRAGGRIAQLVHDRRARACRLEAASRCPISRYQDCKIRTTQPEDSPPAARALKDGLSMGKGSRVNYSAAHA